MLSCKLHIRFAKKAFFQPYFKLRKRFRKENTNISSQNFQQLFILLVLFVPPEFRVRKRPKIFYQNKP